MKKFVSMFLALTVFVASVFSFPSVFQASAPVRLGDSDTYYSYDESTKTLFITGTGNTPDFYNSPDQIPWLDWDNSRIERVEVAEGVTQIGTYLLYNVPASDIILPRSLVKIGRYALSNLPNLVEITIPFGVKTIDSCAFYGNTIMRTIHLPDSLESIGSKAFYNCYKLKKIKIPSSLKSIGGNAFYKCMELEEVEFPSLAQNITIGASAFLNCPQLKHIDMPKNTTTSKNCFGFMSSTAKFTDVSMSVYEGSTAYDYAVSNSIPYDIYDTIPMECFARYSDEFEEYSADDIRHYTFTPDVSESYDLYGYGECDIFAELYDGDTLIAEGNDVDESNTGFCITQPLIAGNTYDLYISSVRMTGDYNLFVSPSDLESFSIYKGKFEFSANDGRRSEGIVKFNLNNELLQDFIIDLYFADGSVNSVYYTRFIAGDYITIGNNQSTNPLTCGENTGVLCLKNCTATFPIIIEHSYTETVIPPCEDVAGYTEHSCILCDYSYRDNYVEPVPCTITGNCVIMENRFGAHRNNVPYNHATIRVGNRTYPINEDGSWTICVYSNCYVYFENEYGENTFFEAVTRNGDYEYGTVALEGYDLNNDGYVNAKDYLIYYRDRLDYFGEDYWQFANEFLIRYGN